MACPLYDELRATLTSTVLAGLQSQARSNQQLLRRWTRGTQARRFDLLMSLQSKDEVRALALFLEKAWDLRSTFLAVQAAPQALQDHWRLDIGSYSDSLADSDQASESEDQASMALPANPLAREGQVEQRRVQGIGSDADSEGTV